MRDRWPAPAARHRARPPEERSLTAPAPLFIGSFPRADVPLAPALPEVVLIGRSNVGKSSLLNALAGRKIARISATPGKTRALNVYAVRGYYCIDLPGYGYASAAQAQRTAVRLLIRHALERPRLAGVLWLLDIRREPSAEDRAMQELFAARQTRVLAALTKSDKLPRSQRAGRERKLCAALALHADQAIVTSARAGEGVTELREAIEALVRDA